MVCLNTRLSLKVAKYYPHLQWQLLTTIVWNNSNATVGLSHDNNASNSVLQSHRKQRIG